MKNCYDIMTQADPEVGQAILKELERQQNQIELIASENIVSEAILCAQGSILTNKYAEGYPKKRYYEGCDHVDVIEQLAIDRVCKLFNCQFANVQPHSGSSANQAVLLALTQPGDTILGMSLSSGGHLTHGSKVNLSGKWFHAATYDVDPETYLLNYDEIEKTALTVKPKVIIAGASAYSRQIDFKRFREIADKAGALLWVDMAHIAGLVAGGVHQSPFPHAHVVTSTTHKTLRGARGGIILTNDEAMAKKINSAVFPGVQGGALMQIVAAKAIGFKEALSDEFKGYAKQVIANAQILAKTLIEKGITILTGGTDNHLMLLDLRPFNITGHDLSVEMESVKMTCNKNGIPFDTSSPMVTAGIRLGTSAATTRGFKEEDFKEVGLLIAELIHAIAKGEQESIKDNLRNRVAALCERHPLYHHHNH